MHLVDWLMTILPVAFVLGCAVYTRRYIKGVADFTAGGRAAGRYLICNAKGEAGSGVANTLSKFQAFVIAGFVLSWWDALAIPVIMLVAISGFVIYRYRQTRAMTVGQFFEMRYSRRFRLFAGIVGFTAGLLNYGIVPAVSANFFIYFMGLPHEVALGPLHLPTKIVVMAGYLTCALAMMIMGGQVTLLVTDCIEGILSHLIYVVVIVAIFCTVSWAEMRFTLTHTPPGRSLINPFDQNATKDFNFWYVLMALALTIYSTMALQKDNVFSSAARNPHEARIGEVLRNWRIMARMVMLVILAIAALAYMRQPGFPGKAALASIHDPETRSAMQVPIALRYMLPTGVKGLFCTMMVLGLMSGDSAHILVWGSIFIQDVVLPLRKTPLSPKEHVRLLRLAVAGVTLFAFLFSVFFRQTQYILMWWAVTEGVFVCGAGAAIIGGLYWKRGTTAGAWAAFLVGSSLSLFGIVIESRGTGFPFNGKQVELGAAAAAVVVYVVVSLLTGKQPHDMDRLLHRGKHAVAEDQVLPDAPRRGRWRDRLNLNRLLAFDPDFTFWDKFISASVFLWAMFWLLVVGVGTIWNLIQPWPASIWLGYWFTVGIVLPFLVAAVTLVWFGVGGIIDLRLFFQRIASMKRDPRDDGTVTEPAPAEGLLLMEPAEKSSYSD